MELSRAADYAVRTMVDLAGFDNRTVLCSTDIARRQRIPRPMLAKIIPQLARAGLLRSRRGTGGGVSLARNAGDISLLDVVEAMEGPIVLNRCVRDPGECPLSRICSVHEVWKQARTQMRTTLGRFTIADLAARQQLLRKEPEALERGRMPLPENQLDPL